MFCAQREAKAMGMYFSEENTPNKDVDSFAQVPGDTMELSNATQVEDCPS